MARTVIALVMAAVAVSAAQAAPRSASLVYLRDIDSGIRQDMRYAGSDNFTGKPLPGYDAPECMLRRATALALKSVQAELATANLSLKVYDCYRPARGVAAMAAWSRTKGGHDTLRFYPALDKAKLFALGYIAGHSAHSRGVAVDLTLVQRHAKPAAAFDPAARYGPCTAPQVDRAPDDSLDMGTGFDCFDARSHTRTKSITAAQAANRRLLVDAMQRHGFTNYKREWWHFSYNSADDGTAFDLLIKPR